MTDQDALRFVFNLAKEHAIDRGRAMYIDPGLLEPYAKQQEAFAKVESFLCRLEHEEKTDAIENY